MVQQVSSNSIQSPLVLLQVLQQEQLLPLPA
jgi:hypothetical protein